MLKIPRDLRYWIYDNCIRIEDLCRMKYLNKSWQIEIKTYRKYVKRRLIYLCKRILAIPECRNICIELEKKCLTTWRCECDECEEILENFYYIKFIEDLGFRSIQYAFGTFELFPNVYDSQAFGYCGSVYICYKCMSVVHPEIISKLIEKRYK